MNSKLHPARYFIHMDNLIHRIHKGSQNYPQPSGWEGWTPQPKKGLWVKLKFVFSFLFLLLAPYFEFSPFQYSHVAKRNNSLQIHPMGLVPRKMLQMSVETRHASEAAVVCCSCISAEVGCEEQFGNLWGENEEGQLKVLWFPHLFCSRIYKNTWNWVCSWTHREQEKEKLKERPSSLLVKPVLAFRNSS